MSATKIPTLDLPTNPPAVIKEWVNGVGETITQEWPLGTREEIDAKYEELKSIASAGGNIGTLTFSTNTGRARLVAKFGRSGGGIPGVADDVTIVEELYAVDVIKDMAEATYWENMTDDQIAFARLTAESRWGEKEVDIYTNKLRETSATAGFLWSEWDNSMKNFRYHMLHGVDSYFETGFVLRRSSYGVRTSQVKATFTGINTVVADPEFESPMDDLIAALPDGEWLKKPPQAEHLGKGRWRIIEEWQWAVSWSIMYGGTWTMPS